MNIRYATAEDAKDILAIYKPYIENTAITFEYEIPSVEEFANRITNTLTKYPYLVMEDHGDIVGYAYASQFRTRKAFEHGAELSIYVNQTMRGKGIGKALYHALIDLLIKQNIFIAYACIAVTDDEADPYLNNDSIYFHEKEGFVLTGKHARSGYKFHRWYDVIWMEKVICDTFENPKKFLPFAELKKQDEGIDFREMQG